MNITRRAALRGAADAGAEVISLERERIRRRIRRRMIDLRAYRARAKNDPAAQERRRRIAEITEIVIEEAMGRKRLAGETRS